MIRRLTCMLLGLASLDIAAAERATKIISQPELQPVSALALPDLPGLMPAASAGCVVLGYHVMPDGSVARPQMLKGAFTGDVSEDLRGEFSRAVIMAATQWRYRFPANREPETGFRMETVGFTSEAAKGARVSVGADLQAEPLRAVCRIDDLAAWGEQNAIPLQQALSRNGDKVIVQTPGEPMTRWLEKDMRPPHYPVEGIKLGVDACVMVGFVVRSDGSVGDLKIVSSEFRPRPGPRIRKMFEVSSASAFANSTYAPGPDNPGRIAEFRQEPVTFEIDGSGGGPECKPLDPETLLQASAAGEQQAS